MNLKKTIIPLFIVLIMAISVSSVAAIDEVDDININNPEEEVSVSNANQYNVTDNYTNAEIQNVINAANPGDTIYFEAGTYNNMSLQISKTLNLKGAGMGQTIFNSSNINTTYSMFLVRAGTNSSIDGTTFYGMSMFVSMIEGTMWNGRVIDMTGGRNNVFDNLEMANGNSGIRLGSNQGNTTIKNSIFTGVTDDSTVGTNNEIGTKSVNIMGGSNINIINNTFWGRALDGVSVASGASNILISGNEFLNNVYGIFFGGGLRNIAIVDNVFDGIEEYAIGLIKASSHSTVLNNTFLMTDNSTAVILEQGNTAHGYPTTIGEVYIDGNSFIAKNGSNPFSITAVSVVSDGGPLLPAGALEITNNDLTGGIRLFNFFDNNWKGENGSIVITPDVLDSEIIGHNVTIISSVQNRFEVVVKDSLGRVVVGKNVTFNINGVNYNRTTDITGVAGLNINLNTGSYNISATFLGEEFLNPTTEDYTIEVVSGMTQFVGENLNLTEKGHVYTTQLVDANWKPIAGAVVSITINHLTYWRTTDADGKVNLTINLDDGVYSLFTNFDGTLQYTATTGGNLIRMNI